MFRWLIDWLIDWCIDAFIEWMVNKFTLTCMVLQVLKSLTFLCAYIVFLLVEPLFLIFSLSFLFQECSFNKLHENTAIRVSFQGSTHIYANKVCSRWFFKFDGIECSGPLPIESIFYTDWWKSEKPDNYRHQSFEGYCENLPQGTVSVELWVGQCSGYALSRTYTGFLGLVSRIIIEEVPPSQ